MHKLNDLSLIMVLETYLHFVHNFLYQIWETAMLVYILIRIKLKRRKFSWYTQKQPNVSVYNVHRSWALRNGLRDLISFNNLKIVKSPMEECYF